MPPTVTDVVSVKFTPVMVTFVPPALEPESGVKDVKVGANATACVGTEQTLKISPKIINNFTEIFEQSIFSLFFVLLQSVCTSLSSYFLYFLKLVFSSF